MKIAQISKRTLLVLCMLLPFLLAGQAMSSAEEGLLRTGYVRIEGKTNSSVLVGERQFMITESTLILDRHGKEIPLIDLPIPCEANLQYRLTMNKDPVVLRLAVSKLFPHSSSSWMYQER
jgi:hypothetical protein